ncbi:hypothetical protein MKK55_01915 [Methylobacterium sp. J-059]|uniref:hypothetical protein n=1 Tax=Methylobacterium sp. J-059 TaxID=2836643 RepID=UPI001FB9237F|nr:hypothetical protein [Methylobacterium sp. J-059]MCJ2037712.1 hypothetical protein [Methylobacterium sp. J-059]
MDADRCRVEDRVQKAGSPKDGKARQNGFEHRVERRGADLADELCRFAPITASAIPAILRN